MRLITLAIHVQRGLHCYSVGARAEQWVVVVVNPVVI